MKSTIRALVLICIVVLSSAASLKRVEKVEKSNSKQNYGSGSWNDGYVCPDLLIALQYGNLTHGGKGKFYAPKLENPSDEYEKLGWVWEMETGPIGDLTKVMINIQGTKKWYIPFRYISTPFSAYDPNGDHKYIEGYLTNDKKENYKFKVNLPWAYIGNYITESQAQAVAKSLNKYRSLQQETVNRGKSLISQGASGYISTKNLLTAATSVNSDVTAAKAQAEEQKVNLSTSISEAQKKYNDLDQEISNLTANLNALKNTQTETLSRLSTYNAELASLESNLSTLGDKTKATSVEIDKLKADMGLHERNLNEGITVLKTVVVQVPAVESINNAEKAVKDLNTQEFSKHINAIYP